MVPEHYYEGFWNLLNTLASHKYYIIKISEMG